MVRLLKEIAGKYGKEVPQVAINWLLKFDDVFPIFGAKRPEHVVINAGSAGWRLSDEDWRRITEASNRLNFTFVED